MAPVLQGPDLPVGVKSLLPVDPGRQGSSSLPQLNPHSEGPIIGPLTPALQLVPPHILDLAILPHHLSHSLQGSVRGDILDQDQNGG